MRRSTGLALYFVGIVGFVLAVEVPEWHAPVSGTQLGPNASSMVQFAETSPWRVAAAPRTPEPPAETGGPSAVATYKNVQVLKDLSAAEFMRLQTAMTAWVSPKQGCAFCHVGGAAGDDFASDANPMKEVTRNQIRMTRHLNTDWKAHMGEGGITCFGCHRGEPVPPETWFPSQPKTARPFMAKSENWDETADTVRKFFPDNGWALYYLNDEPIRGQSPNVLSSDAAPSQVQTKRIYEMMMQMSDGIGVNCGYCHNSRAFWDWSQSTPSRWVAYDAIRMVRDLNVNFLVGLHEGLPQTRELVKQNDLVVQPEAWTPRNGSGLTVCATCHYGHVRPDQGVATIQNYGALAALPEAGTVQPAAAAPLPVEPGAAPSAPPPSDTSPSDTSPAAAPPSASPLPDSPPQ